MLHVFAAIEHGTPRMSNMWMSWLRAQDAVYKLAFGPIASG
jgi:hypothetical protein